MSSLLWPTVVMSLVTSFFVFRYSSARRVMALVCSIEASFGTVQEEQHHKGHEDNGQYQVVDHRIGG